MTNVEFDETYSTPVSYKKAPSGITGLLIKWGLAKDTRQANIVMIGIIIVMSIIFVTSLSIGNSSNKNIPMDPDDPSSF